MPQLGIPEFSLKETLTSGQTFRWKFTNGWYYGVVGSSVLRVKQKENFLLYDSSEPSFSANRLRRYFALDVDLSDILRRIDVDMQVHQAIEGHRGLRVLRQDGWEVLASFICATFNNIKRIEGMLENLCQAYGRPISLDGFRTFGFPSPEQLARASERSLRSLGLGYRAAYLRATARLVAEGKFSIEQLKYVDYGRAKAALLNCAGVGDKVADCVSLFGCEKYEAFPLDVWITRVMRYYFRSRKMTQRKVHEYARRHFGAYAGYAQQYLYHHARSVRLGIVRK